jgi:hypothetical protein
MFWRYYSYLKEITVQIFSTDWTVTRKLRVTVIFLGGFLEERGRCCTVTAVRRFADGITAGGQEETL